MLLKDSIDFRAQEFLKSQHSSGDNTYLDSFSFSCFIIQPSHNLVNEPSCQIGKNLWIQTHFIYLLSFPLFSRWESHKGKSLLPIYVMLVRKCLGSSQGTPVEWMSEVLLFCRLLAAPKETSQKHFSSWGKVLRRRSLIKKISITFSSIVLWIMAYMSWCYGDSHFKKRKRCVSWKREELLILSIIIIVRFIVLSLFS